MTRESAISEWHATAWPSSSSPPRVFAASVTWVSVEGYTCPRASSMRSHTEMASGNDPHASSSATSIKFPSEWLFAMGKRYLNARVSGSFGSAAIARMHLRTSPGGVTSASSRKRPVEPPSSAIATTALVSTPSESRVRMDTGAPVPPPMTTALSLSPRGARAARGKGRSRSAAKAAVAEGSWMKGRFFFIQPTPGRRGARASGRGGQLIRGNRSI